MIRKPRQPIGDVRLVAMGTRVVILKPGAPHVPGVVSEVRLAPHLKTYVVTCDDGAVAYASGYDLAREDDASVTRLGAPPTF